MGHSFILNLGFLHLNPGRLEEMSQSWFLPSTLSRGESSNKHIKPDMVFPNILRTETCIHRILATAGQAIFHFSFTECMVLSKKTPPHQFRSDGLLTSAARAGICAIMSHR